MWFSICGMGGLEMILLRKNFVTILRNLGLSLDIGLGLVKNIQSILF